MAYITGSLKNPKNLPYTGSVQIDPLTLPTRVDNYTVVDSSTIYANASGSIAVNLEYGSYRITCEYTTPFIINVPSGSVTCSFSDLISPCRTVSTAGGGVYLTQASADARYLAIGATVDSSSYALSASYAPPQPSAPSESASYALTASYALNGGGTTGTSLNTGSSYPITSSWAQSASYVRNPVTESNGALYYGLERLTFGTLQKDPTGFPNRTDTTLTWSDTTKTFAISGSSFKIYSAGKEYTKNTEAVSLTAVTAGTLTRIYYDETTLNLSSTTAKWNIESPAVPVATVYWDGTRGILGDERHGIQMDGKTQEYLHETMGARYAYGGELVHTGSNPKFIIDDLEWYDDDNEYYTGTGSLCQVLWHSGSILVSTPIQTNIWITSSAGDIAYDNLTTSASVPSGRLVAYWLYATNGVNNQFMSVMGQRVDTTLDNARSNNVPQNLSFGTFPLDEAKLLYRIIYNSSGVIQDTTDYRQSQFGGSNYTATDHGTLSGLADDDHIQYLLLAGRDGGQAVVGGITASLQGTSSRAITASYALSGVGGGTTLGTGSTYPITSSWATTATTANAISFVAATATSASWVSASARITTADTASYYNQRWLATGSSYPITASWSITASYALAGVGGGTTLTTGSTYPITASWANNATPSFSGKTDFNVPVWISNTPSATSSLYVNGLTVSINRTASSASPEVLFVRGTSSISANNIAEFQHDTNNYAQIKVENLNSGTTASADYIVESDKASESLGYSNFGINSSTYAYNEFNLTKPLDSYLYSVGSASLGGNLVVGTLSDKSVIFHTSGSKTTDERMRITSTGVFATGSFKTSGSYQIATGSGAWKMQCNLTTGDLEFLIV